MLNLKKLKIFLLIGSGQKPKEHYHHRILIFILRVLLKFKLHLPYFEALNVPVCNSSLENQIKWSELQINNKFLLGDQLPVPNSYKNAAYVLEMLLKINNNQNRDYLITALPKINLERNDKLIKKLLILPQT